MKRIFVAIPVKLEPHVLAMIGRLKTQLEEEEIRWVPSHNYHVTLHFLGNVDSDAETLVGKLVEKTISGQSSFNFQLNGFRYFSKRKHPQVLFLDVADCQELNGMVAKLKELLKENGFPAAVQQFRPHLTVARMKQVRDLGRMNVILNQLKEGPWQMVNVSEVVLYESELNPTGVIYMPLREFIIKE